MALWLIFFSNLPLAERKRRKAKEALRKKNEELDVLLSSQIKSKRLILSFLDAEQEKDFRDIQEDNCQRRMPYFVGFYCAFQLLVGFNVLQYGDADWNQVAEYYVVIGSTVFIQVLLQSVIFFKLSMFLILFKAWLVEMARYSIVDDKSHPFGHQQNCAPFTT